jgi:hypothetical protein
MATTSTSGLAPGLSRKVKKVRSNHLKFLYVPHSMR